MLIHVGFPKAASTWLQRHFFLPSMGFHPGWTVSSAEAVEEFIIPLPFQFDPEEARAVFAPDVDWAHAKGLVPTLSHEDLLGAPNSGQYHGHEVMRRLRVTFPDAKVLLVIREQCSALVSLYQQRIRDGGWDTIEDYIGVERRRPGFAPICRYEHFDYHLWVQYCQELFGLNGVLVLPVELLRSEPDLFCYKVQRFMGLPEVVPPNASAENRALSGLATSVRRRFNRWIPTEQTMSGPSYSFSNRIATKLERITEAIGPEQFKRRIKAGYRETVRVLIGDHFEQSNMETSRLIGIDLQQFGYAQISQRERKPE